MRSLGLSLRLISVALLCCLCLTAQQVSLAARDALNMGVREFQAGQFRSASQSFAKAVERAPSLLPARIYLAAALVQAYVPDDPSPENEKIAVSAIAACQEVLKRDPGNVAATDSLATVYFQKREFLRSREWNLKVLALEPKSKTSLYMLGAIIWTEFSAVRKEARITVGMAPDDPGPLRDEELRSELRAQYLKTLNDGIEFERASLSIAPDYSRAMLTIADLLLARADLGSPAEYAADVAESEEWVAKGRKVLTEK